MAEYTFILKDKSRGLLTDKGELDDDTYGIQLVYDIYGAKVINIFGRKLRFSKKFLGVKTFFRPSKKDWDKLHYKLPYVYWGSKRHRLTRLWFIVQHAVKKDCKIFIIPEISLINHKVKLFGKTFISHDIAVHLFKREKKFTINSINQKLK